MKRFVAIIAALTMTISLAACGNTTSNSGGDSNTGTKPATGGDKKITVWCWDQNFNIAAANIAKEAFEKSHEGVTVDVVEFSQPDVVSKLNTGLASGNSSGLPDVVLIEDYRVNGYLTSYNNAFVDLTDKMDVNNFSPYKLASMTQDGKTYGIPFDSGVVGTFFRTDLLEQAGYKKEDLANLTWDQFIDIAKKVKEVTGLSMMTQDPKDIGLIRVMMQSAGKWYVKEDGQTPDIKDNEALREALVTFKKLMDSGAVSTHTDWASLLSGFNSGKVAATINGCWITPSVSQEASQSGKWAVAEVPRLNLSGAVNASNLGGSSWYVLAGSKNADLATEFAVDSFAKSDELLAKYVEKINLVSTVTSFSQSTDLYKAPIEFFGGQKIYEDFSKWNAEIPKVNYGKDTYQIDDILKGLMPDYLSGKKDLDTVINEFDASVASQVK